MKKRIILLLLIIVIFFFTISVSASDFEYITQGEEETLNGNVIYKKDVVKVKDYNTTTMYKSTIQTFELKGDNKNVQIVTWSYVKDKSNTTELVTLDKIAENYEALHPGYEVICGINAEGYHQQGGTEISNAFVQDYKFMRTGVSSESFKELIGFKEDNSHIIKRLPEYSDNLVLTLYDENKEVIQKIDVKAFNNTASDNDLVIYDYANTNVDLGKEYNVFELEEEVYRPQTFYITGCYALSNTDNDIYAEGKNINSLKMQNLSRKYGYVYAVTNNNSYVEAISKAASYKLQYEFIDDFKNCKSVTGYMFKIIEDGNIVNKDYYQDNTPFNDSFSYSAHSYVTTHDKCRSAIGFKEDGSIMLVNAENGKGGPSLYELGTVLKEYGCNYAYQFDGGGSASILRKTNDGTFEFLNPGSDGHQRSISTGLFFVREKSGIDVNDTTKTSVSFNKYGNAKDIEVTINDKVYKLDNTLTIDGFKSGTKYSYTYICINEFGKEETGAGTFTTVKFEPNIEYKYNKNATSLKIQTNYDDAISEIAITINQKLYHFDKMEDVAIDRLEKDTQYQLMIEFKIKDVDTGEVFDFKKEDTITTLKNYLPEAEYFEITKKNDNYHINYSVVDIDNRIDSIDFLNEDGEIIVSKSDLNDEFDTKTFVSKIIINYFNDSDNIKEIEIDNIEYTIIEDDGINWTPILIGLGCALLGVGVAAIVYLLNKKNNEKAIEEK